MPLQPPIPPFPFFFMCFFKLRYRLDRNQCNWHFYCFQSPTPMIGIFLSQSLQQTCLSPTIWTGTFLQALIWHTDNVFDTAPMPLLYDSGNVGPLKQPSFQRDVVQPTAPPPTGRVPRCCFKRRSSLSHQSLTKGWCLAAGGHQLSLWSSDSDLITCLTYLLSV